MIVAVVGGKGGVGKSTTSWNLGRELDAVVVDADLATADLPRGRGPDLHDVLADRAPPMDAVEEIASVRVLPSGRTLAGARAADLSSLPETLSLLDRQVGSVVVDCPAGLARDVGVAVDSADVATIVTTPDKPALLDAMKTRDLVRDVGTPLACLALNRVPQGKNVDGLASNVQAEFGAPVTVVRESDAVAESQAAGRALRESAPDSDALASFQDLAEHLEACRRRTDSRLDV